MTFAARWQPPGGEDCHLKLSSLGGVDVQGVQQNSAALQARNRMRRQRLVEHLHRLGPAPLGHFIREVEVVTGADITARLERYAEIDPGFVRALGGDKFAPPFVHAIGGGGER